MLQPPQPDPRQGERDELETLLASEMFSRCPHLVRLLRYICDKYWEGKADELKEYNLAVEALGRTPDFDPTLNPIARVEVHRLRERLNKYYNAEGSDHLVVITLPVGSYIPRFIHQEENALAKGSPTRAPEASPLGSAGVAEIPGEAREDGGPSAGEAGGQSVHPPANGGKDRLSWRRFPVVAGSALVLLGLILTTSLWRGRWARTDSGAPYLSPIARASAAGGGEPIRIIAGYFKDTYIASCGNVYSGDRYFNGGDTQGPQLHFIARTRDPTVFEYGRSGNFSYDIPLLPGSYVLWLHVVEAEVGPGTVDGEGGENRDNFSVDLNGKPLLPNFDPVADARGPYIADTRVFKGVGPASDGYLHLMFRRGTGKALLNSLQIIPTSSGKLHPIRMVAQNNTFTDKAGQVWHPDRYFFGGRLVVRRHQIEGAVESSLYAGERFGAFDYAIPVAEGKYGLTLYFSESYFGSLGAGGVGSRVFDVYCNGEAILRNFDIFKEANGTNRALQRTFHGLTPNAQGKLMLTFVPVSNYACINAIEVVDESK